MTTYNRPDANVPVWAESGDKVRPTNPEVQTGWPNSNVPPSRQRFNWILNFVSNAVRYLLQRGLPEWSASEDYPIGARIQYGGLNYVSLTANTNKQPDTNTSDWEQWGYGDTAFQGRVDQLASFSVTTADVALTAAQAKAGILNVSGTLTGNCNIIIPNSPRRFVIINGTSGAYSLGVKTASGSAVTVAQGAATSVVCDGANNVKLASTDLSSYAPINSPALTGVPTAPTPARFDNDTSLATTAFVKEAGLLFNTWVTYSATGVISIADAGRAIQLAPASPITLTLPAANAAPSGTALFLINTGLFNVTIQRGGADTLVVGNNSGRTSIVLLPGDDLLLITNAVNGWFCVSGSAHLPESGQFSASLAASGYQKLPSGLIIQWGTAAQGYGSVVNLPVAFPNAALQAVAVSSASASNSHAVVTNLNTTQITLANNNNGGTIRWLAWGI